MKINRHRLIESRTRRDRDPKISSERFVDLSEQFFAEIYTEMTAKKGIRGQHRLEKGPNDGRLCFDRIEDLFVKQIPKARNGSQYRRLEFLHRLAKLRRRQLLQ